MKYWEKNAKMQNIFTIFKAADDTTVNQLATRGVGEKLQYGA